MKNKLLIPIVIVLIFSLFGFQSTFAATDKTSTSNISALAFNGQSNYVNLGDGKSYDEMNQLTLEVWVKLNSKDIFQAIVSKEQAGGYGIDLDSSGRFKFSPYINGNYQSVKSDSKSEIGKWYHIVGVYDGKQIRLYVNNVLQKDTISISGTIKSTPNVPLTIGTNPIPGGGNPDVDFLDAEVSRVRVWERALSKVEISKLTDDSVSGSEQGLIGYWSLDSITTKKVFNKAATTSAEKPLSFKENYINLGNGTQFDGPTKITVEAWAKINNTNHEMTVVSKAQGAGYGIEYFPSRGAWDWSIHVNGDYHVINADEPIKVGQWYHLVGEYDGHQSKFYVDGKLQSTILNLDGTIDSNPTTPLTVGMNPTYGGPSIYYLDGEVSQVRVWNDVRTPSEINKFADDKLNGNEKDLIGYWVMDPITTKEVFDKSSGTDGIAYGYQPAINLSGSPSDLDMQLKWSSLEGATGYQVIRNGQNLYKGNKNDFKDTPLVSDTDYTYEVFPYSPNGEGVPTKETFKTLVGSLQLLSVPSIGTLNPVTLNGAQQTSEGELNNKLTIKDTRKNSNGWHLTVSGNPLKDDVGHSLPSGSLKISSPSELTLQEGSSDLPSILKGTWSVDDGSRKTLIKQSDPKGFGIYDASFPSQSLKLSLDPGATLVNQTKRDSNYQSTLTWTLVSGP